MELSQNRADAGKKYIRLFLESKKVFEWDNQSVVNRVFSVGKGTRVSNDDNPTTGENEKNRVAEVELSKSNGTTIDQCTIDTIFEKMGRKAKKDCPEKKIEMKIILILIFMLKTFHLTANTTFKIASKIDIDTIENKIDSIKRLELLQYVFINPDLIWIEPVEKISYSSLQINVNLYEVLSNGILDSIFVQFIPSNNCNLKISYHSDSKIFEQHFQKVVTNKRNYRRLNPRIKERLFRNDYKEFRKLKKNKIVWISCY